MRETFTSGTVGGALGNQCFDPEISSFTMVEMGMHISSQIHSSLLFTKPTPVSYPENSKQARFLPQM
jgi:hypothetical protein